MSRSLPNLTAAVAGLVISSLYLWQARAIEDSLLSDEVGAGGVPAAVAILMMAASLGLLLKTLLARAKSQPAQADDAQASEADEGSTIGAHGKALGLLAILAVYVAVLPWAGYLVSLILLAGAVGLFAGARRDRTLLLFAVCLGPLLWFLFDRLLQVRMPAGVWPTLLGA